MEARINGLEKRMDKMDLRLEKIETKLEKILILATKNDDSLNRINGTIADLKIKDKQHDKEISNLNKFKSGLTYIGAAVVLIVGYIVQFLTAK